MNEDVMVIPLRVPRDVGRAWKLEAVKQDKSVQRWILDRLGGLRAGSADGDAQRIGAIPKAKTVTSVSITDSESKPPAPSPSPKPMEKVSMERPVPILAEPKKGVGKAHPESGGRTTGEIPVTGASLKEGYGWCMACKVEQVKLPAMLCGKCAKP